MGTTSVALIGAGKVGSTLALAFHKKGCRVACVVDAGSALAASAARAVGCRAYGSKLAKELGSTDFIILAVPDGEIRKTARELAASNLPCRGQVICHTSGFLPASEMSAAKAAGACIASFHPMFSVARRLSALPSNPYFGLEGDRGAVVKLKKLVKKCGWSSVVVKPEQKALYHAACVLATGMNAALLGLSQSLFQELGFGKESLGMVRSLAESMTANIMSSEIEEALTGPLVRGQADVMAEHLKALKRAHPKVLAAYRALGLAMLGMAGEGLDKGARERIAKLLKAE